MQNRFIFSLRFFSKVFLKFSMLAVSMIVFMSLFRMNLYFLSVFHATPDVSFDEVVQAFLMGARFDILVFGFIFIPLYIALIIQAIMQKWPTGMFILYKTYFTAIWFLICSSTFMDFMFFVKHGSRMRFSDYSSMDFDALFEQFKLLPNNQIWVFSIITIMLLTLGLMLIRGIKFGNWKDEYSPQGGSAFEAGWRLIAPLFVVILAARGTVEPHHLSLEHSQISNAKAINEMVLNPIWCFDK
jgi:hypothetical protein